MKVTLLDEETFEVSGLLDGQSKTVDLFSGVYSKTEVDTALGGKQDTLSSGTTIKTINNTSLLGSGDVVIPAGKDAYQSYVDTTSDNPPKTESQWVASLKGADGMSLGEIGLVQTAGSATDMVMSQNAVTETITDNTIKSLKYNNFAVCGENHNAVSTVSFSMSELSRLSSFKVYGCWDGGTRNRYNEGYYLGITKNGNPASNFFGIHVTGYNIKLLLKVNGTVVSNQQILSFSAGSGLFPLCEKNYTVINFVTKKINMFGSYMNGTNISTIIEGLDFSQLDLSSFTDVQIVTSMGHSNNSYTLFDEIHINNFFTDYNELFARKINYGEYNNTREYSVGKRNPATPSMFYVDDINQNVTLTIDEPLHKKFSINSETR